YLARLILAVVGLVLVWSPSAQAQTIKKASNFDNLNLTTSWALGAVPTAAQIAEWDSTVLAANTTVIGNDLIFGGIKISNPTGLVTINATATKTLTLGTSGIDMTAATQDLTINGAVVLGGSQTWDVQTGRKLVINAAIVLGGNQTWDVLTGRNLNDNTTGSINAGSYTLTVQGGGHIDMLSNTGALLSGNGTLIKTGTGTLRMANNDSLVKHSFTGDVWLKNGTLENPQSLDNASVIKLGDVGTTGTMQFYLNAITSTFKPNITLVTGGNGGNIGTTGTTTFSGVIDGGGALTIGTGNVRALFTNNNIYTNTTLVSVGTLRANNNVGLPGTGSAGGGSYLNLNGGVFETGANLERVGGTGQGQMQITGGTSGFSAFGAPVQVAFGSIAAPTALTWGTAPFQPGTFVLNTSVADNTIDFKNAIDLGTSARTVQVNANVATLSGILSSGVGGGLTKTGAGTLVLANANTHSGTTTLSAGTLNLAHALALQNSTVSVNGGALTFATGITSPTVGGLAGGGNVALATVTAQPVTLNVGGNNQDTTFNGSLIGVGGLTKVGTGTLTLVSGPYSGPGSLILGAANTYVGPTTISNGTLKLGDLQYRLVFVSSTTRNANSQFIADYDTHVSNAANAVPSLNALGTTWLAIGSTGPHGGGATVLAPAHTSTGTGDASYPIYRLDGTLVATGNADLWDGTLAASISVNESGNPLSTMVWTGTKSDGTIDGDWYLGDTGGGWRYYGNSADTAGTWTQNLGQDGVTLHSLYGISLVITAGKGANLLPTTTTMAIASGATLDLNGVTQQQVVSLSDSGGGGGSVSNSAAAYASVLTLAPTSGSTTFSGAIVGGGSGGAISLVMNGSGSSTQVLAGVNTYTGATTVSNGTLSISGSINGSATVNVNGGLLSTTGADKLADTAAVTVAGGTLTVGGADTVGSLTMSSGVIGGSSTLTAATYGLSGGTVTGNLGLGTLTSSGAVALNGTAAAGTVNVTAGTLTLGAADRLSDSAAVAVSGGALAIGGYSDTVGAVSLTSGGAITGSGGVLTSTSAYALQSGSVSAILGGSVALNKTTGVT
ncbi:MAG: autotransporter-associated beta strand repeat-containing protein, partial [Kiritimatiellaeota bacterium]|nr:autotransporter-associated beta strand repeat-containing protein [Kiritimatiellota bacterium]